MAEFTDEQLRGFARNVITSCTEDIDYIGVAEKHEAQWAGLDEADRDRVHRAVYDLAVSATVTVSWPNEEQAVRVDPLTASATPWQRDRIERLRDAIAAPDAQGGGDRG